ncbi:MAG: Arm DNA-binding domain-containing protein, partial [Bacteroidetes bacterium]|nr:Arm DNA-binding domain-containing protein [Bacteroidota bacterium]
MRNYSTYKIVWDRRGNKGNAPVEIEIHLPDGTRKYVATGLKIPANEWDAKSRQITNSPFATKLNNQISDKVGKIRAHELILIDSNRLLTGNEVN